MYIQLPLGLQTKRLMLRRVIFTLIFTNHTTYTHTYATTVFTPIHMQSCCISHIAASMFCPVADRTHTNTHTDVM